jgi:hypothetical protein
VAAISTRGFSRSSTRFAGCPGEMAPVTPGSERKAAGPTVAARSAAAGDSPAATSRSSSSWSPKPGKQKGSPPPRSGPPGRTRAGLARLPRPPSPAASRWTP